MWTCLAISLSKPSPRSFVLPWLVLVRTVVFFPSAVQKMNQWWSPSSCWNPFFFSAASTSRVALIGNRHLFHDGEKPVFQFQRFWGQIRVWGHRIVPPDHHKIFGHLIEQVTNGASKGIQPKTRVFDADKLRIVIVEAWLQAHGLFESQPQAFVLHFVHFQGRKIQRPNRLQIEHVFYLAILVAGNSASDLNSRLAVLKKKIFHRVLVGHLELPVRPFWQNRNLAVRKVNLDQLAIDSLAIRLGLGWSIHLAHQALPVVVHPDGRAIPREVESPAASRLWSQLLKRIYHALADGGVWKIASHLVPLL